MVAESMVIAARKALDQIERNPGIGSPRIGELLDIPGLRSWRVLHGARNLPAILEHDGEDSAG